MGEHCNDWVTCFQAVRTKLSHASYEQQRHKAVSHGVLKANNFLVKLKQNGKITGYPYLHKFCVEFSFSLLSVLFTDFYERFSFLSLFQRESGCFLCLSSDILRGNLARDRPELIPSRMPDV